MIVSFVLLICSIAGLIAALVIPGLSDLSLLALPCAIASFYLLLCAAPIESGLARGKDQKWLIIDGSNVMHWKEGAPKIDTVREVVAHLHALGFNIGVVFDANAGHILTGRYLHHRAMGKLVGLAEDRVMVVDKGTPADATILAAARDHGARIVTNDRYRDWADAHPEAREPGHLIRGNYRDGTLWLDLADAG